MPKSQTRKANLLSIIFILILIGMGYVWYSYFNSQPQALVTSSASGSISQESSEFLALLRALETTKIDIAFFQNPLYQSLGESTVLPPLPSLIGRVNPFLPIR